MSLRGLKKQLYRTPHQLFGTKSADDSYNKQWEHDLTTAVAGLEFLKLEQGKWHQFWIKNVTNFVDIVETFKEIHGSLKNETRKKSTASMWGSHKDKSIYDIDNEDVIPDADGDEELTKITMYELNQASKMGRILLKEIEIRTKECSSSFNTQCDGMISIIKGALKLLTKRNHKKIDFDMQKKKVDALSNIKLDSKNIEKDKANYEIHNEKLADIDIIFQDIDQKVKAIIPQLLSSLSEFIYKLTMKLQFTQNGIQKLISRNLDKFVQSQGLSTGIIDYDLIIEEYLNARVNATEKLESLVLLKDFRDFRENTLREKTVKGVNTVAGSVVDSTVNLSSTIYTKTTKPGQKVNLSLTSAPSLHNPVKLFDKNGMFTNSTDPIEFLKTNSAIERLSTSATDGGSLNLSYFPTNEGDDFVNVSKAASDDNKQWMKPLKNQKANKEKKLPALPGSASFPNSGTASESLNAPSLYSEMEAPSEISSVVNDKTSETFKVANISMLKIRYQIAEVIQSPNIDHCPITASNGIDVDEGLKNYVTSRSSITTQII